MNLDEQIEQRIAQAKKNNIFEKAELVARRFYTRKINSTNTRMGDYTLSGGNLIKIRSHFPPGKRVSTVRGIEIVFIGEKVFEGDSDGDISCYNPEGGEWEFLLGGLYDLAQRIPPEEEIVIRRERKRAYGI